jgi:hypothetical protein
MVKDFPGFFTEHLTLNRENFSPSSYRKFEFQKFELWKKHNMEEIRVFFFGNMNPLRVIENSDYRRSSYRSSTVYQNFHASSMPKFYWTKPSHSAEAMQHKKLLLLMRSTTLYSSDECAQNFISTCHLSFHPHVGRFNATHVSALLNSAAERQRYVLITGGIQLLLVTLAVDRTP